MASAPPDRHEPLPGPLAIPGFLWRKLDAIGKGVVVAVAIAVVIAAALLVPGARTRSDERVASEAASTGMRKDARLARLVRQVRPRTGRGPAGARAELAARLQADILADALGRARRGELEGRFQAARCFRFPKGLGDQSPAAGAQRFARLECIAVTARVPPSGRTTGSLIGQPFRALIDFARGRYAWCRVVQRPGELSITRAPELRPAAACGG